MHRADRQFLLTSIFVICTLIVSFATMFARADDWYVDVVAGNDSNDGSEGSPWKTITHAFQGPMNAVWVILCRASLI